MNQFHIVHNSQADRIPVSLDTIDKVVVAYSGGKDSLACALWALRHFPKDRIELWHHDVDGAEGDDNNGLKFDWAVTRAYCKATAKALGLPLQFSWREGGIGAELFKTNARTADILYADEGSEPVRLATTSQAKVSTRRRFPALSADLQTRWCSGSVKIDIASRVVNNLPRFKAGEGKKAPVILFLTGERREESSARAKYDYVALNAPTRYKHLIKFRPVLDWSEAEVWEVIKDAKIAPHPAYVLGFGRCSCQTCIFGTPDQWATINQISPEKIDKLEAVEIELNHTIRKGEGVRATASKGKSFLPQEVSPEYVARTLRGEFRDEDAIVENWIQPAGAFKGSEGGSL